MKALVFVGPVEMAVMERPDRHPGRGEVLVAVRASGICGSDVHGYLGLTGRRQPGMVMGHEAAGQVIEAGPDVMRVRVGDRVALRSILPCGSGEPCRRGQPNVCEHRRGLGMQFDGAYAERMVVPEALTVPLPESLSFEVAALVEPLAVALHAAAITPLEPGDAVVIVGAGPIGLLTLLVLRLHGARFVAITDRSPHRLAGRGHSVRTSRSTSGRPTRWRRSSGPPPVVARTSCSRRSESRRRSPNPWPRPGPAAT
jgi:L-iditol 2-dehydrogenase